MAKQKTKIALNAKPATPFNNPFAALTPAASLPSQPVSADSKSALTDTGLSQQGKLTVRVERKGRGGKTVTLITGLQLSTTQRESLCRELKRQLGCGATLEDGVIVLQGALGERTVANLQRRGVKSISQSGF